MNSLEMDKQRFLEIINKFGDISIAVAGDFFLDRIYYTDRALDEDSVETGLTAYQVVRKVAAPGSAGTITNNLHALGVKHIYAVAAVGGDGEGFELLRALRATGVDTSYIVKVDGFFTPTYSKTFFEYPGRLEETHRVDIKNRKPTPRAASERLAANLLELVDRADAFICLEQLEDGSCGVFTPEVLKTIGDIGQSKTVLADSRFNLMSFKNTVLKCNDAEALRAAKSSGAYGGSSLDAAILALHKLTGKTFIVTRGGDGVTICDDDVITHVPAYTVEEEVDICGAGDSLLAGMTASLCAGADFAEAALIGNLVASLTVQQIGVTGTATREMLKKRFDEYMEKMNA